MPRRSTTAAPVTGARLMIATGSTFTVPIAINAGELINEDAGRPADGTRTAAGWA
ncbi:hypothetical protein RJB83_11165 [Staphylococcus epidermidis]|uniref:hypothetical protein n=1 Tax=Staphylococcus TaxID=1279 RepID=UPI00248020B1|nr:hypothetical protein [Staphylococcus epidermidis]ELG7156066.1 hypothetical protein [Staphylococcus aureus]MDN3040500.1 hypothetical protein [Enterococcus faecium]ELL1200984.1 hypothetical protein [Staphylococcus aureus]MDH9287435.1 hypothetical protein [Staphylococcus epidermidis]MDH9530800.1 hypothetical protein [Staphylococcus epidermidis]